MYFLKLIRPFNLLIIVLTMHGTVFYLQGTSIFIGFEYNQLHFWLLTLSTVMIAAAGNIINDYFDVKADRINKPEKLIITKHIKRRWAIVSHWALNGCAFLIGVYLSVFYDTFSFVFFHLISINLLWFYSMFLKRKVLIGNLVIALLTSLIPVLSLIFMYFSPGQHNAQGSDLTTFQGIFDVDFYFVHIVAFFAFFQNLAREIIKDIQDVKGDKLIYVKSLPMVAGYSLTISITAVILLMLPAFMFILYIMDSPYQVGPHFNQLHFFLVASVINLIAVIVSIVSRNLKLVDGLIKLSMLFGILTFYQLTLF